MNQEMNHRIVGATPPGAQDRDSAAQAVREMFTSIAPRYDLLNHVLSFNIDRLWWWRTARTFDAILKRPTARALDICCGTGDMTFALRRRAASGSAEILGADFSHAMLQRAAEKAAEKRRGATVRPLQWIEADALHLPFPDGHFNLVTSAFGFRNLADYDAGLREIVRVLAPGGECGILDFGEPGGLLGRLYRIYFKKVLPADRHRALWSARSVRLSAGVGRALSRARGNARAHASGRIPRRFLDSVHIWHRGTVPGSQERVTVGKPREWSRIWVSDFVQLSNRRHSCEL